MDPIEIHAAFPIQAVPGSMPYAPQTSRLPNATVAAKKLADLQGWFGGYKGDDPLERARMGGSE